MGGCIEGQNQDLIVDPAFKTLKIRRASSIENTLNPKVCRGGPTERNSTLIRRNFVRNGC